MNRWIHGDKNILDKWVDQIDQVYGWMNRSERSGRWMDGWIDGLMYRWTGGLIE